MSEKKFDLSKKIFWVDVGRNRGKRRLIRNRKKGGKRLYVKDVKEFIRQDMLLICLLLTRHITEVEFWKRRGKLKGEELSK